MRPGRMEMKILYSGKFLIDCHSTSKVLIILVLPTGHVIEAKVLYNGSYEPHCYPTIKCLDYPDAGNRSLSIRILIGFLN